MIILSVCIKMRLFSILSLQYKVFDFSEWTISLSFLLIKQTPYTLNVGSMQHNTLLYESHWKCQLIMMSACLPDKTAFKLICSKWFSFPFLFHIDRSCCEFVNSLFHVGNLNTKSDSISFSNFCFKKKYSIFKIILLF